jgi:hypothetical protein
MQTSKNKEQYIQDTEFQKFVTAGFLVLTGQIAYKKNKNGEMKKDMQWINKYTDKTITQPHPIPNLSGVEYHPPLAQEKLRRSTEGTADAWGGGLDNTIAMMMGHEYAPDRFIILIDVDNKNKTINPITKSFIYNGFDLWNKLKAIDPTIEDTPRETTPSKGLHAYYYITRDMMRFIPSSAQTIMKYENQEYAIDYKFTNQPAVCCPSSFKKGCVTVKYKWIGAPIYAEPIKNIKKLPDVIFNLFKLTDDQIFERKANENIKNMRTICPNNIDIRNVTPKVVGGFDIGILTEMLKYIPSGCGWNEWSKIRMALRNLNENAFELFDAWSKTGHNYGTRISTLRTWKGKCLPQFGIGYLFSQMKRAKVNGYELAIEKAKRAIEDEEKKGIARTNPTQIKRPICIYGDEKVEINQKYLSAPDGMIHTDESANEMDKIINEWLTGDTKALAIRSPYGTGKTTLIANMLKTFGSTHMQTVLYVCYRRSLCRNIAFVLRDFQFVNYLDGGWAAYCGDRQIIQLDSIHMCGETYDMIILDETESLLRHLTGCTITGKSIIQSMMIYNDMREKINKAKKVLLMDGDYDVRSNDFIRSFGAKFKVVINKFIPERKTFELYHKRERVDDLLITDLENGKKMVIVCMAAKDVTFYEKYLRDRYPKKNIMGFTSKSDDNVKNQQMSNASVDMVADVLLYSPVIESGVDINVEHYDCLYIMYSAGSVSVSGLSQMISRVRKFRSNVVRMCISGITSGNSSSLVDFSDMLECYKITMNKTELNAYDMIVLYNEYEASASEVDFLNEFTELMKGKGHEVKTVYEPVLPPPLKKGEKPKKPDTIQYDGEEERIIKKYDEQRPITYKVKHVNREKVNILAVSDIDEKRYNELDKKKVKGLTTTEKYEIERYSYAINYGLHGIPSEELHDATNEVIERFYGKKHMLYNYCLFIDNRNHKNYKLCKHAKGKTIDKLMSKLNLMMEESDTEKIKLYNVDFSIKQDIIRVTLVRKLLKEMGFDGVNDKNTITDVFANKFDKLVKIVRMYEEVKATDIKINSVSHLAKYVKNILFKYGIVLNIHETSKRVNGVRKDINVYSIELYEHLAHYAKQMPIYGIDENEKPNTKFTLSELINNTTPEPKNTTPEIKKEEPKGIFKYYRQPNARKSEKGETKPIPTEVDDNGGFIICDTIPAKPADNSNDYDDFGYAVCGDTPAVLADGEELAELCINVESEYEDNDQPPAMVKSARGTVARCLETENGKVKLSFW